MKKNKEVAFKDFVQYGLLLFIFGIIIYFSIPSGDRSNLICSIYGCITKVESPKNQDTN